MDEMPLPKPCRVFHFWKSRKDDPTAQDPAYAAAWESLGGQGSPINQDLIDEASDAFENFHGAVDQASPDVKDRVLGRIQGLTNRKRRKVPHLHAGEPSDADIMRAFVGDAIQVENDATKPCPKCHGRKYRKLAHGSASGPMYEPCWNCEEETNDRFGREYPAPGAPLNILERLYPHLFVADGFTVGDGRRSFAPGESYRGVRITPGNLERLTLTRRVDDLESALREIIGLLDDPTIQEYHADEIANWKERAEAALRDSPLTPPGLAADATKLRDLCDAVAPVLAAYRATETGVITKEQITKAWAAYDEARKELQ